MRKCEKCGHNGPGFDGDGLHLCRGGNLFKILLELELKKKEAANNGILFCGNEAQQPHGD